MGNETVEKKAKLSVSSMDFVGLGFAAKQAEEACDKVLAGDPDATTSGALRATLNLLGKNT